MKLGGSLLTWLVLLVVHRLEAWNMLVEAVEAAEGLVPSRCRWDAARCVVSIWKQSRSARGRGYVRHTRSKRDSLRVFLSVGGICVYLDPG